MQLEDLIDSLREDQPPSTLSIELQSLWWDRKGDWEKAHELAQEANSREGDWIHAYLHRVEGDLGNAGYWYRRAGKPAKGKESLREEWEELVTFFLGSSQVDEE